MIVRMNPILSFELLFFAVFGQTTTDQTQVDRMPPNASKTQPYWTEYLFKFVFGIYMLVSVVVLINLLIAMMSDTYQRIQVQYADIVFRLAASNYSSTDNRSHSDPILLHLNPFLGPIRYRMEVRTVEADPEHASHDHRTVAPQPGHHLVHVDARVYSGEL